MRLAVGDIVELVRPDRIVGFLGGTSTSSAPSARIVAIFSALWLSGMTMIVL
jgi:hypothetical protein